MPEETPPPAGPKPPARKRPTSRRSIPVITENRLFAGIVLIVTAFVFSAFITLVLLALVSGELPTTMQLRVAGVCERIIELSIPAVAGQLVGSAATPDRVDVGGNR